MTSYSAIAKWVYFIDTLWLMNIVDAETKTKMVSYFYNRKILR